MNHSALITGLAPKGVIKMSWNNEFCTSKLWDYEGEERSFNIVSVLSDSETPVFIASDTENNELFCVKIVEERERFAWKELHEVPGIVPVVKLPVITTSGTDFWLPHFAVVMPKLRTWKEFKESTDQMLVQCAARLSETLVQIHAAGWFHRDISPNNVLFDDSDDLVVYLGDLGSSIRMSERRSEWAKEFVGTPKFAASDLLKHEHEQTYFRRAFDWMSLIYTMAWLSGCRWSDEESRPSFSELYIKYPACAAVRDSPGFP